MNGDINISVQIRKATTVFDKIQIGSLGNASRKYGRFWKLKKRVMLFTVGG